MVGLIAERSHITTQFFKNDGDVIILVGETGSEMGASRFLKVCHGRKEGLPPRLDVHERSRSRTRCAI
jgi:phosphoribosylformylglycinamidine synthase